MHAVREGRNVIVVVQDFVSGFVNRRRPKFCGLLVSSALVYTDFIVGVYSVNGTAGPCRTAVYTVIVCLTSR